MLGQRISDQRQGPGAEHHGHLGSRVLMAHEGKESDVSDLKNCIYWAGDVRVGQTTVYGGSDGTQG